MRRNTHADFLARLVVREDGCWEWIAGRSPKGYAMFRITLEDGTTYTRAHIYSYEHYVGPVPTGLTLDHFKCDREWCVNYEHLRPATNKVNVLRGNGPTAQNARKTKCPRGHKYDKQRSDGRRYCSECKNDPWKAVGM